MEEGCTCSFDDLATLPRLPLPPESLRYAVRAFVDLKYALDECPEAVRASLFLYHTSGKLSPWTYCRYMLPFFDFEKGSELEQAEQMMLVPTETVIGASDSWGYWDLAAKGEVQPSQVLEKIFELSARYVRGEKTSNVAHYYLIKPLGVVIAHEGKNRVDLFRKTGTPYIPARLGFSDYPAPERIKVYKKSDVVIAVLDTRYACLIRYPRIVLPLLSAYGVRLEQRWDTGLAPFDDVQQRLQSSKLGESRNTYLSQYIDLQEVACQHKSGAELVPVALHEITCFRPPWWLVGGLFVMLITILTIRGFLPKEWGWPSMLVGAVGGALAILPGLFTIHLLKLPRSTLNRLSNRSPGAEPLR